MLLPRGMSVKHTLRTESTLRGRACSVLLVAVFALKLLILWDLRDHPLLHPDAGLDTTAYADLARRVAGGDVALGPGLYYVSPLYIYFLAAGLALTGSFTVVQIVQVLLGTLSVGLIFICAREWFGARAGWAAAVLAAFTGLFTFYESLILQSSIDTFLASAALCALTLSLTRSSMQWLMAAGLVFGITVLNRPNILLAAAGVALAFLAVRRVKPAIVLAAGLVLGMLPALVRNVVVTGEWTFVSSHGGLNFYIGNNEHATGFYQAVPGIRPTIEGQQADVLRVARQGAERPVSESEASGYFFRRAFEWMRAAPGDAVTLFVRKLGYVFSAQHVALPHSYPFYANDEQRLLRLLPIGPWLLIPLGVTGLVFVRPAGSRSDFLVWAAFVPGYAVAVAVFFVAERYRLPLLVPLAIGGGALLAAAASRVEDLVSEPARAPATAANPKRPRGRPAANAAVAVARPAGPASPRVRYAALGSFVLAFVLVNWPLGLDDGRWQEGLRTAQRLIILGEYEEADVYVERFEPRGPYPGATYHGAGMQLLAEDAPERAVTYFRKAQSVAPGRPQFEHALGQALLKSGDAAGAVPHLRRAYEGEPAVPLAGYDLAVALKSSGDLAGAVDAIRHLQLGQQEDSEVWLRVGRLASQAGAPDAAERFFREAVRMRPDQASARQQLGLNLLLLERWAEAAQQLDEARRLDPRNADTLAHLAYCELKLGRAREAREHVAAALALAPSHPLATQLRGLVKPE
jgi:tetratricopeptide (TPR) repeat protein/4-amino-4-deoxy-L-arabinose transferase-like glycosyltransferase